MSSTTTPRRTRVITAVAPTALVLVVLAVPISGAALLYWAAQGFSGQGQRGVGSGTTVVAKVVDGDTIEVNVGSRTETVRLLGIDTPETKDPRKPVQCFGQEASARTAELLPPGTPVRLEHDVERRDRYDRVLAYVYRSTDGLFVNLALARDGYADLLTYPPNVAHTVELSAAVADARRARRGLWQACASFGQPT